MTSTQYQPQAQALADRLSPGVEHRLDNSELRAIFGVSRITAARRQEIVGALECAGLEIVSGASTQPLVVRNPSASSWSAATWPFANPTTAPTPKPSPTTAASTGSLSARVGNVLYAALWIVCTFFPAIGRQIAPGGEVGDKQEAFFAIYIATAPLSLAATFIFLMLFEGWFDDDRERLFAAGVAIVASAAWGIGFGTSYADMHAISQLQGPWYVVGSGLVLLALFAYAIYYGWALFIAGVLASFFAAVWIHEKAREGAG